MKVRALTSHGIENTDLTENFLGEKNSQGLWVARDDAHPNAIAHEMIAKYSYPFLAE